MTEQLHFYFSLSCIGEGNGSPLQCSCLENPRDRGGWWAAVYGVAQSRTRLKWLSSSSSSVCMLMLLSQFLVGKRPTTLSQEVFGNKGQVFCLTWRDWPESTEESPATEPNGSRKHSTSIVLMTKNLPDNAGDIEIRFNPWVRKIPWSRKWQPAPVFLSGKFHGQRTLVGYSPWGHKELDTTEHKQQQNFCLKL